MRNQAQEKRILVAEAIEDLNMAYRHLGDAADCLRGLGFSDAIEEIGRAKGCINNAKNAIEEKRR